MGNCFKRSTTEDISLLRETNDDINGRIPFTRHTNSTDSLQDQASASQPIYSEIIQPIFYPTPSVSGTIQNLTEEEQIKLARRIGLIQHLPIGQYSGCSTIQVKSNEQQIEQSLTNLNSNSVSNLKGSKLKKSKKKYVKLGTTTTATPTTTTTTTNQQNNDIRECVICMIEFNQSDQVRYLPCMHIYHVNCIDNWLMRSLTCPSCMEPIDAALLTSYERT